MTILHKRILYLVFFAIFFALAPIVVLYAQGYKFDFKRGQMVKTGVLFLESKPKGADIYLNGKKQKNKTTARIPRLLPGEYDVVVSKEGFKPWHKQLMVAPNQTTFAQYLRLFKDNPQLESLAQGEIVLAKYSQDQKMLAFVSKQDKMIVLNIFNLRNNQMSDQVILGQNEYQVEKILWSNDAQKVIIQMSRQSQLFKTFMLYKVGQLGKLENLNNLFKSNPKEIEFCTFNQNLLYFYDGTALKKFNLLTKENEVVVKIKIDKFYPRETFVYYSENNQGNTIFKLIDLAKPETQMVLTSLPIASDWELVDYHSSIFTLYSKELEIVSLIKLNNDLSLASQENIFNVKKVIWHDKSVLAWSTDFELWIWDMQREGAKKELLTRVSSVIEDIFWYPVETHLGYATNNELRIIELVAHSGVRETTKIFTADKIKDLMVNSDGSKIYFADSDGLRMAVVQ